MIMTVGRAILHGSRRSSFRGIFVTQAAVHAPSTGKTVILAVSSGGGHWEQLMIIRKAFSAHSLTFANTIEGLGEKYNLADCTVISDCNRNKPLSTVKCAGQVWSLISSRKPDVIVSTGALPGLLALALGKLRGRYCIWIDSVANAEKLSMSGKVASYFCDLCVVQWQHIADNSNSKLKYFGSVL